MLPGTVCAPLRSERAALRGATTAHTVRTGRGPTQRLDTPAGAIAVAGVAGALDPSLRPGDLVVAQQIRRAGTVLPSNAAPLLYSALRRLGLRVHLGPIFSAEHIVDGPARDRLAATGALAVDTESAFLADAVPDGRTVVIRAIVDTRDAPLVHPGTVLRGIRALHALRCAAPVLDQWSAALGEREVLLAGPSATDSDPPDLSSRIDLVLALGSPATALTEAAAGQGIPVQAVHRVDEVDLGLLAAARRIAVSVTPTVPPSLTSDLLDALSGLGPVRAREATVTDELSFHPREVS
ncbi:hypothetical protein [Nocardia sp. BMG51109]|uniref:phosphorylase family protein n=1 Tax=Nocardia sp. BMG51109 TaxID=1056816 RepID=UPI0004662C40|nr:hypothetical protein [Nocardia sp. BMG51109]